MAPALRIPLSLDMDSFRDQTAKASSHIGETLKLVGRQFADLNKEMLGVGATTAAGVATGWAQSATRTTLAYVGAATAVVGAVKLIGAAVDIARDQLEKMVAVADKASQSNVSPQFFQAFTAESKKLQVGVDDLEGALTSAFNATKEKSPIDVSKWEAAGERITEIELALRVYNATVAKAANTQLQGLVLFRDAQTQDQKIQAVLTAMTELNAIGQKLAALDLGEKMLGSQFADRIRQGKTSAESLLATLKDASNVEFSDQMVRRAKEVDDQLKIVYQRLDKELKPTWDGLADKLIIVKQLWADIVGLVADAVAVANKFGIAVAHTPLDDKKAQLANVQALLSSGPAIFDFEQKNREALRDKLMAEIAELEADAKRLKITVTPASRGSGAAPTEKSTSTSSRDRFDSAAESVEKRTAGLQAEADTMDLLTEARERARIAAQLETVAKQVNAQAGLGENIVTDEQRKKIDEVAAAYGRAAVAIENSHSPLATFARDSQNVSKQLNQFAASSLDTLTNDMADVITHTKSVSDAFRSMAQSIISDLAKIAIRKAITGPIANGFSSLFTGSFGGSNPVNVGSAISIGANANGTDNWRGGPTWVGEDGPEIINAPKGSQIIPNNIARKAGGDGAISVPISINLDARGADPASVSRLESLIGGLRRDIPGLAIKAVQEGRTRSVKV